ncbi:MAG: acyl-[acyl-carrier-protein] thioesterase [Acidimicrobiales bacterium]
MAKPIGATELVPRPADGRTFSRTRRVRLADTDQHGALRLDALFRYVQDVSSDDARDALPNQLAWVVRRVLVEVAQHPVEGETVELTTWCGGVGSRWAERRTSVVGDAGGHAEAAAVWVALDPDSSMPVSLPAEFEAAYGVAAQGRHVSARLQHPPPATQAHTDVWQFRAADIDVMGHVNNTAYWTVAEELLEHRPATMRAEAEFREPAMVRTPLELLSVCDGSAVQAWLVSDGRVLTSLVLSEAVTEAARR